MRWHVPIAVIVLARAALADTPFVGPLRPCEDPPAIEAPGAPTRLVWGRLVPVLREEPSADGLFVVPADAPLAAKYRTTLLRFEPDKWEWSELKGDRRRIAGKSAPLPEGFPRHLVSVGRDERGRFYLAAGCGAFSPRFVFGPGGLIVLAGPHSQRISLGRVSRAPRGFTVALTKSAAAIDAWVPDALSIEPAPVRGLYSVTGRGWMMTPEAAAQLPIVVNRCVEKEAHAFPRFCE